MLQPTPGRVAQKLRWFRKNDTRRTRILENSGTPGIIFCEFIDSYLLLPGKKCEVMNRVSQAKSCFTGTSFQRIPGIFKESRDSDPP